MMNGVEVGYFEILDKITKASAETTLRKWTNCKTSSIFCWLLHIGRKRRPVRVRTDYAFLFFKIWSHLAKDFVREQTDEVSVTGAFEKNGALESCRMENATNNKKEYLGTPKKTKIL